MGSQLPALTEAQFRRHLLVSVCAAPLGRDPAEAAIRTLYRHYSELCRWNPRLSLVGPGTAPEIVPRHYGESLAATALIGAGDRTLVDIGSGAGFPGLVLAAAEPALDVILVESRQRKWAFLRTAVRRAGLSCRCLNARVGRSLPSELTGDIDLVTCRGLTFSPRFFELFHEHSPRARFLLWLGKESPEIPERFETRREIHLAGSRRRRILEICCAS